VLAGNTNSDTAARVTQAAVREDAWRVYSALLDAVASAMRERMIEQADVLVAASRWVQLCM
jgi:hypothetical protein